MSDIPCLAGCFNSQRASQCNESDLDLCSIGLARRYALKPETGRYEDFARRCRAPLRRPADELVRNSADNGNERNMRQETEREGNFPEPEYQERVEERKHDDGNKHDDQDESALVCR